jgi:hypothetical protein
MAEISLLISQLLAFADKLFKEKDGGNCAKEICTESEEAE